MESNKLDPIQPRYLRYRSHYRVYLIFMLSIGFLLSALWAFRFFVSPWREVFTAHSIEAFISGLYYISLPLSYFFWLKPRINHAVQVFSDHLLLHKGKQIERVNYGDIESVTIMGWSLFYLKLKSGLKYYFNSDLERVDYIWEGLHTARPELFNEDDFEKFRVSLVQHDHHQKRKEWFYRHKLVDVVNWFGLPLMFMGAAYLIQSRDVYIYQQSLYFFRLFMYALLILLVTSFAYSLLLKKLIFDRRLEEQHEQEGIDKVRDLEFEGVIIQRSKVFQVLTSCFLLALVVRGDVNFFSLSKTKGDLTHFNIPTGKTLIVDNRYNCFNCRYSLADGDMVMFGKGLIGQVLAKEDEPVGEVLEDTKGRTIASLNVKQVPKGHVAVKASNGKDVVFIKVVDLIGKIQK